MESGGFNVCSYAHARNILGWRNTPLFVGAGSQSIFFESLNFFICLSATKITVFYTFATPFPGKKIMKKREKRPCTGRESTAEIFGFFKYPFSEGIGARREIN